MKDPIRIFQRSQTIESDSSRRDLGYKTKHPRRFFSRQGIFLILNPNVNKNNVIESELSINLYAFVDTFYDLCLASSNPLQYSCLDNLMDRRAWQAIFHVVSKSQTQLKQLSTHTEQ